MKTEQILAELTAELKADNDKAELKAALRAINSISRADFNARNDEPEELAEIVVLSPTKRDYWSEGLKAEYDAQIQLETMMGDI